MTSGKLLVYSLTSLVAVAALFNFGPECLGGAGDLAEKVKAVEHLWERERREETDKVILFMLAG